MKDCRYEQQTHFQDYEKKGTFDDCPAPPKAFTRPPRFPQWIDLAWRFEQCVLFCAEGAEHRVISDCHFAVHLNHFIPGFLSYSVAVFRK